MALTTQTAHLPALGTHQREEIGQQLQAMLVDSWRELADTVAERAVALGFMPDGQSATVAAETPLRTS